METLLAEEVKPGIVVVTLNRPDRYNAMTNAMFVELEQLAWDLGAEDDLRVVILTGAGKAFCSGYDLADADELPNLGALGMLDQQERAARALAAIRSVRVPVIAAVNGAAAGGGFSLSLAADIRIGGPAAKFNAAFVRIGLSAGDLGTSWLLTRLIGPAKTSEICFTGRIVEAAEAEELGLVNWVADDDPVADALALAEQIVGFNFQSGLCRRISKSVRTPRLSNSRIAVRRCSPAARICPKLWPRSRKSARRSSRATDRRPFIEPGRRT